MLCFRLTLCCTGLHFPRCLGFRLWSHHHLIILMKIFFLNVFPVIFATPLLTSLFELLPLFLFVFPSLHETSHGILFSEDLNFPLPSCFSYFLLLDLSWTVFLNSFLHFLNLHQMLMVFFLFAFFTSFFCQSFLMPPDKLTFCFLNSFLIGIFLDPSPNHVKPAHSFN